MSGGQGHGHDGGYSGSEIKRIALLIFIPALVLSISETLDKGAQTMAIDKNIETSNLWPFSGAGVGWHHDRPAYEDIVAISFLVRYGSEEVRLTPENAVLRTSIPDRCTCFTVLCATPGNTASHL